MVSRKLSLKKMLIFKVFQDTVAGYDWDLKDNSKPTILQICDVGDNYQHQIHRIPWPNASMICVCDKTTTLEADIFISFRVILFPPNVA